MPTEPYDPILNRDPKTLPKVIPEILTPCLREVVNYATNFYQRCQVSKEFKSDDTFPILALYLHLIQMTDSIEVLISNGCTQPANLLLRSSFEAKLAIKYMLEKDTKQRALCWMTKNIIDKIEQYRKIDPGLPQNETFIHNSESELCIPPPNISTDKINNIISNLKASLGRPGYKETYEEYLASTKNKNKYAEWYSFYNGPKTLKQLATHFGEAPIYQNLYASWSRMSHFSDADHLTVHLDDGDHILGPIRNSENCIHIGNTAISTMLDITQLIAKKFRPYESNRFDVWYPKEVRNRHVALTMLELEHLRRLSDMVDDKL
jgi:Family of unknown function (DUF5677)